MMMSKKKILLLITLLIIIIIPQKVSAVETTVPGTTPTTPSPGGGGGTPTAGTVCMCNTSGNWQLYSKIEADIYDTNGKLIGSGIEGINAKFTAGRFAGIDAYEKFIKTIKVNVESVCVTTVLTCSITEIEMEYTCKRLSKRSTNGGKKYRCWWEKTEHHLVKTVTSGRCPESWLASASSTTSPNPNGLDGCLKSKEPQEIDFGKIAPSFTATYYNSNDINKPKDEAKDGGTYTVINEPTTEKTTIGPIREKTSSYTGTITKSIEYKIKYNLPNSCVNVKTGLITIRKGNCTSSEITAHVLSPDGNDNIGKYFIPLNTKTGDLFKFELNPNQSEGALREASICLAYITKYPSIWRNFIRDKNGNTFYGVSESVARNKIKNDKYCKYGITATFYVDQEFYEENNTKAIEGYGFYFRPIDINNPFPNGLNSNYWNDGNTTSFDTNKNEIKITDSKKVDKTYKLKDSFKELTYVANNINASDIRAYNKENFYTSWDGMNKKGESIFVKSYLTRKKTDFYNLGCGPANAGWEECKK